MHNLEALNDSMAEIKKKLDEQHKTQEDFKLQLNEITTVITGGVGGKGFAKRLEEVEAVKAEVAKIKNALKWWGIVVLAASTAIGFVLKLVIK